MTPFFHPTSILALDEDPLFLESLVFQFSDDISCQTFSRTDAALEHLINQAGQHPCYARMYDLIAVPSAGLRGAMRNPADTLLCAGVSSLRSIIDDPGRHLRVSVAIVDYDMSDMDGLEFCRTIRNLPVKKILLSGKAGLEVAVDAFNEGIIDCFLQKQDKDAPAALRNAMRNLQRRYFIDVSSPIANALELCGTTWFSDQAVRALIQNTVNALGMTEYCLSTSPPGVVMRDPTGNETFMLISDRCEIAAQIAAADARGAPDEFIDRLSSGKVQAWFPTSDSHYSADYHARWHAHMWPADTLRGDNDWLYSLIPVQIANGGTQARSIARA